MSHFSVMVIDQNVEQQLAPYHEFECTGVVDQYVQSIDKLEETRAEWKSPEDSKGRSLLQYILHDHGDDFPVLEVGGEPDLHGGCKWGWVRVNADGEVIEYVDRTNPNKKWDWWRVGGRYSNRLKLKSVNLDTSEVSTETGPVRHDGDLYVDQALKRDIDIDGMRDEAGIEAAAMWDKAADAKVAAGFSADAVFDTWPVVRARHETIEAARDEYHSQAVKAVVSRAFEDWVFRSVDEFLTPRDEYIQKARDGALAQYALVKDSQWFAKGEMGWFGMSTDGMTQAEWNRKVNELLDELPDDTMITIVDCHI